MKMQWSYYDKTYQVSEEFLWYSTSSSFKSIKSSLLQSYPLRKRVNVDNLKHILSGKIFVAEF